MRRDDTVHRECLAYRMALPYPAEFDVRRSLIQIFADWDTGRYVKTVQPLGNELSGDPMHDELLRAYYRTARRHAQHLWQDKYGEHMPESVEGQWAETTPATALPYDGPTALSEEEWGVVKGWSHTDFTLTELWFLVEGLGWKPGTPVSEDDERWVAVWAEEQDCCNYLQGVRQMLGMSDAAYYKDYDWVPPAVAQIVAKARSAAPQ
ncbi:hypothetical protein [Ralstonia pickettii]|uniref:hypothetical protein n=1 Tax=Ralstonia pickettii TaxID=329 RepID=UPI0011AF8AE8|nr:hypothetical protein [Ralstonia pickettii]